MSLVTGCNRKVMSLVPGCNRKVMSLVTGCNRKVMSLVTGCYRSREFRYWINHQVALRTNFKMYSRSAKGGEKGDPNRNPLASEDGLQAVTEKS
jgi:hypothetical protein